MAFFAGNGTKNGTSPALVLKFNVETASTEEESQRLSRRSLLFGDTRVINRCLSRERLVSGDGVVECAEVFLGEARRAFGRAPRSAAGRKPPPRNALPAFSFPVHIPNLKEVILSSAGK
jgi:hypothetical protein